MPSQRLPHEPEEDLYRQATLGDLIHDLGLADPEGFVAFDFGGLVPSHVDSWRGIYAEAALGWERPGHVTVRTLLERLTLALGAVYQGWKGGNYQYTSTTPLHIDNPGAYTLTEITWVEIGKYGVTIHTEARDLE